MDLQKMLDNAVNAERADRVKTSIQLTLVELTLQMEAVKNKKLPVVFDIGKHKPSGLDSWRGSYRELAIRYKGGGTCYEQPKPTCQKDRFGYHHYDCKCGGSKGYKTSLPENPTVNDLLKVLKLINGKYVTGWKGGDFTIGKTTPVWVANSGESKGFRTNKNYDSTAVIDVIEKKDKVVIKTKLMSY